MKTQQIAGAPGSTAGLGFDWASRVEVWVESHATRIQLWFYFLSQSISAKYVHLRTKNTGSRELNTVFYISTYNLSPPPPSPPRFQCFSMRSSRGPVRKDSTPPPGLVRLSPQQKNNKKYTRQLQCWARKIPGLGRC